MKLRMKTGLMTAATLLALTSVVTPRVNAEAPAISGFIDTTYNYSFNRPFTGVNELRSFDTKANSFLLNAAQIQLIGSAGDAAYVVKLLAGTDAGVIKGNSNGAANADDFALQEAYLTYKCPMTGINLKGGKFATPMGIEVMESKDDPTVSRGYLFGLAEAYTHTGVFISHAVGSKVDAGVGVVNGWDLTSDNNSGKTLVGKVAFNFGDPLALTFSALHGPEQADNVAVASAPSVSGNNRSSFDVVAVVKIIPKVTLNIQGNIGTEEAVADWDGDGTNDDSDTWSGAGIQPVVSITDKFSIGSRLEYFFDKWGSRVARTSSLGTTFGVAPTSTAFPAIDHLAMTNVTIAPAYKLTENFTTRLEYRYDTANKKAFVDDEGKAKDTSSTVSVQWLYIF